MIHIPTTPEEFLAAAGFLGAKAHVEVTNQLRLICWKTDSLKMVVGFNNWIGKTCCMHVAMADGFRFTPRAMLRAVFAFAFDGAKCEMVFGLVNSKNVAAMRYDQHLGFKVSQVYEGMHDDGGDLVILTMKRGDCRYLKDKRNG